MIISARGSYLIIYQNCEWVLRPGGKFNCVFIIDGEGKPRQQSWPQIYTEKIGEMKPVADLDDSSKVRLV